MILLRLFYKDKKKQARFQVYTAASMKITDFWDILPCSFVEIDGHFGGTYSLRHHSAIS